MNDVPAMIPVLRRFVLLRRLFDWLQESLEASRNSTVEGYPELPILLLESLERTGHEIASASLLKYCERLRALNKKIELVNQQSAAAAAAAAIDLQFDHLPPITAQYKIVRKDCLNTVIAWLVIPALIVIVIALRSCCP